MGNELGRVLDPTELARASGPRARLRIDVAEAWTTDDGGLDLEVTTPARLVCARCDGGGCDGCARSGALVAPRAANDRLVRTSLSPASVGLRPVLVRITRPFGDDSVDQLLLEVRVAEVASVGVARLARHVPVAPSTRPRALAAFGWRAVFAAAAVLALVTVAVELAGR